MRYAIITIVMCLAVSVAQAPLAKEIIGTVTDKNTGEPISGAAVYVKGTTTGTITDDHGEWKLMDVPHDDFILVFQNRPVQTVKFLFSLCHTCCANFKLAAFLQLKDPGNFSQLCGCYGCFLRIFHINKLNKQITNWLMKSLQRYRNILDIFEH